MSDDINPNGSPAAAPPQESAQEPQPEPNEAAEMQRLLQEEQGRAAELEEHVKRVSAEFENFRRRQTEEQKRRLVLMKEDLFRELLPVVDNLERTIAAAQSSASHDALLKGVELIARSLNKILENNEIRPIPVEGAAFDPALHEAMMVEERDDVPDQTIVMELQKGYLLGERVLRPSMVKVARHSGSASSV